MNKGLQSLHAKRVHVLLCMITCKNALSVKSAEKLVFLKMRSKIMHAKDVIIAFVNMGDTLNANIVETLLLVNMGKYALNAKSAEALLFVNMGDNALNAKSVGVLLYVNMGENALNAKSAGVLLFVSMGDDALDAKSPEVLQHPAARLFMVVIVPHRSLSA